jgi:hypothetical protein
MIKMRATISISPHISTGARLLTPMVARMGRYEDRQRAQDARAGIKKRKGRQFLLLYTNVKRSKAYHGLSPKARALLFELIDRYNGINNGMIGFGAREAAHELQCGKSSAATALQELDDSGLARAMTPGAWRGKKATEWRLMFLRCNKTQEPAVTKWEQRPSLSQSGQMDTKVQPAGNRDSLGPVLGTQKPNSSMNGKSLSPVLGTHTDIYQGPGGSVGLTQDEVMLAESLAKTESNQQAQNNVALSANPKNLRKRRKP